MFTEDGQFQREVALGDRAPLSWIASPDVLAESGRVYLLPSAPGSFVLFGVDVFGPGEGVRRVSIPSYRVSTDGTLIGEVGHFPGEATFSSAQTGISPYPLGLAASIREILDAMPTPARRPAYTGLVTSDTGRTWVGEYRPGQLELGVAYMGRMRVPARRWLVFGEQGTVWGVYTDELDVESVRAYDVLR